MIKVGPIIEECQYRKFGQNGITFEEGLGTYAVTNRTLSSYAQGKKWENRDSCLVRGYWGDILISPYFAFGTETDSMPEKEKFFKKHSQPMVQLYVCIISQYRTL